MKNIKQQLKSLNGWFRRNNQNILLLIMALPLALSILALLFQGFNFAITGEWEFEAQRLFVGFVTSLIYGYGSYRLWVYLKLLNNAG